MISAVCGTHSSGWWCERPRVGGQRRRMYNVVDKKADQQYVTHYSKLSQSEIQSQQLQIRHQQPMSTKRRAQRRKPSKPTDGAQSARPAKVTKPRKSIQNILQDTTDQRRLAYVLSTEKYLQEPDINAFHITSSLPPGNWKKTGDRDWNSD